MGGSRCLSLRPRKASTEAWTKTTVIVWVRLEIIRFPPTTPRLTFMKCPRLVRAKIAKVLLLTSAWWCSMPAMTTIQTSTLVSAQKSAYHNRKLPSLLSIKTRQANSRQPSSNSLTSSKRSTTSWNRLKTRSKCLQISNRTYVSSRSWAQSACRITLLATQDRQMTSTSTAYPQKQFTVQAILTSITTDVFVINSTLLLINGIKSIFRRT